MSVQALFTAFLLAAPPLYSQRQTPSAPAPAAPAQNGADTAPAGAPGLSRLSVFELLEAAAGIFLDWRLDWPLPLPPGLFHVLTGTNAVSIAVTFESPPQPPGETGRTAPAAPEGNAVPDAAPEETAAVPPQLSPLNVQRRNGVLTEFPVFLEESADAPGPFFLQGNAEYGGNGALRRITVGGGPDLEAVVLDYDEENRPVLVRLLIADEYFFSALEYASGRVTETRYDQDGLPAAVMYRDNSGETVRIRYGNTVSGSENTAGAGAAPSAVAETRRILLNASGAASELRSSAGIWSALYERRGLPRYLGRTLSAATVENGAAPAPVSERYSFQWDENGRLIRLTGTNTDGQAVSDSRYEYTLDSRGNWTERREITMRNAAGRLFPAPGLTVRRRIVYDAPQADNLNTGGGQP